MSVFFFNIILFIGIFLLVSLAALWWYEYDLQRNVLIQYPEAV